MRRAGRRQALAEVPLRVGVLGVSAALRRAWRPIHRAGIVVVAVGGVEVAEAEMFIESCTGNVGSEPTETDGHTLPTSTSSALFTSLQQNKEKGELSLSLDGTGFQKAKVKACVYDELINCREVDVVYVTIPVEERDEWVKKCIRLKKHVLLSIPAAPSAEVFQSWMDMATPQRLLLTDDAVLMYSARMGRVWRMFGNNSNNNSSGDDRLGSLQAVRICCRRSSDDYNKFSTTRDSNNSEFGVLADLGWLVVATVLQGMRYAMPHAVLGRAIRRDMSKGNRITEFAGELLFTDAGSQDLVTVHIHLDESPLSSSFLAAEQSLVAYGTLGSAAVHDLIVPVAAGDGCGRITVAAAGAVGGGAGRREKEVAVREAAGEAESRWRRLREALARNPRAVTSRMAVRFLGDTEEALMYLRRSWSTQTVIDAMREAATRPMTV